MAASDAKETTVSQQQKDCSPPIAPIWRPPEVTSRVRPTAEYLVASKLRVGRVAAGIYREFHGRFLEVAGELGFDPKSSTTPTRSKASKGSTRSSNESAPIRPNMDRSASAAQTLGKSEPSL